MRPLAGLTLAWCTFLGCSEGERASSTPDAAPGPSSTEGIAEGDVNPTTGAARFTGPCRQERDEDLDGVPEFITKYTYASDRLSTIEVDAAGDGTIDERYTYSYESGRVQTRSDVTGAGAPLRTLRYAYSGDGTIAHVDVHDDTPNAAGGPGSLAWRSRHMYLSGSGLSCNRQGQGTILRWDDDAGADGTSESWVVLNYDASGHTRTWTAYNRGAVAWIQRVASRDAGSNALLLEIDYDGDGSTNARIVQNYDCWATTASAATSLHAPAPVQDTPVQEAPVQDTAVQEALVQTALHTAPLGG